MEAVKIRKNSEVQFSLKKHWMITAILFSLSLILGVVFWGNKLRPDEMFRWVIVTSLVQAYALWFLWVHLEFNYHKVERRLFPGLGIGNCISMVRGIAISFMLGLVFIPKLSGWLAWLPTILYWVSFFADYFDGFFARRSGQVTLLGEALDMEFDILELFAVISLGIWLQKLPLFIISVGLLSYVFLGIYLVQWRLGKAIHGLPSWHHAPLGVFLRIKIYLPSYASYFKKKRWPAAGLLRGFFLVMLWPTLPQPVVNLSWPIFTIPFLARSLYHWLSILNLPLLNFPRLRTIPRVIAAIFFEWLSVPVRFGLFGMVLFSAGKKLLWYSDAVSLYASFGFPIPEVMVLLFGFIEMITGILIVLGVLGRYAASALLIPLVFPLIASIPVWGWEITLALLLYILVFDTGNFSLWKPIDKIFSRRMRKPETQQAAN